jgi:hypothetical protein
MSGQARDIAICHLVLRGNRWMPVSVNKKLGPNDRCSPGGAVISATLCAVVEGDAIVGWMEKLGSAWLRESIPLTGVKQTAMLRRGNANY